MNLALVYLSTCFLVYFLPKPACDVIFCPFFFWDRKECLAFAIFHKLPLQEECRIIGGASCLLHRVWHKDDRVFLLEFLERGFHLACGDGVESGGGFVEQNDL